jgi:5-methylcytosine-specific restriction protein A
MCIDCLAAGRLTKANTVDHALAISEGGHPFPGHDGLNSYCAPCHGAKTARGAEAGAIRSTKPRRGCDINGTPFDPDHHWNKSLRADGTRPTPILKTQLVNRRVK